MEWWTGIVVFYYTSTRNFLLPVTISTSVHLFLVIISFCEVLMGTSDAYTVSPPVPLPPI